MFRKLLVVIDMQKDFVDGALGTPEARKIVSPVCKKIRGFDGDIIFTKDTHTALYLHTQEGKKLPVPHCIKGTEGWNLFGDIERLSQGYRVIEKPTFGSVELANAVVGGNYSEVELIGLCTDICVISNAMLIKAFLPEMPVVVDSSCCAGVTPESHENALKSMQMCQIDIK